MQINASTVKRMKIGKVFKDNTDTITSIDFSADGESLVTAAEDQQLVLYNCTNGTKSKAIPTKKYGADLVRFTHDNSSVIHASKTGWDHAIRYLSLHTCSYVRVFKGHRKPVVSQVLNPSNDTFASGSLDGTVRFWDLKSNQCQGLVRWSDDGGGGRVALDFDPTGNVFAAGLGKNEIKLFDVRAFDKGPFVTFQVKRAPGVISEWSNVKFSPCGKYILGTALDGAIFLIDSFDGSGKRHLSGHLNVKKSAMEAGFTPDSKYVVSGSEDGSVYMWNIEAQGAGTAPEILSGHGAPVGCVRWNPKKMMLASACSSLAFWVPQ